MIDVSVYRMVLLMVRELHLMGYERIRISPGMSPSGLHWRCSINAADKFSESNGARLVTHGDKSAHYTSGQEDAYFGWTDTKNLSPEKLAERFMECFPDIIENGKGEDTPYVEWYLKMLQLTHPCALPIAYSDWRPSSDYLSVINGDKKIKIPLPPSGSANCPDDHQ